MNRPVTSEGHRERGAEGSKRVSRSPSPFRRFSGRAASPGRVASPPATPDDSASRLPTPSSLRRAAQERAPERAQPWTPEARESEVASSARDARTVRPPAYGDEVAPPPEPPVNPVPDPQDRTASREAAAQKHAARLKAVRTSSRGKWGFSV